MESIVEETVKEVWEIQNKYIEHYNNLVETLQEDGYEVIYDEKSELLEANPAEVISHFLGGESLVDPHGVNVLGDIEVQANSYSHPVNFWITLTGDKGEIKARIDYVKENKPTEEQRSDINKRLKNDLEDYELILQEAVA